MPRTVNEYSDQSGEVIGEVVADILIGFEGQVVDEDLIEAVRERIAMNIGLVGLKEAAEILDRPGYRLSQLVKEQSEQMPQPITVLAATPVWLLKDIEKSDPLPNYKPGPTRSKK